MSRQFDEPEHSRWRSVWKAVRPYQWSKNGLLLIPIVTSHRVVEIAVVVQTLVGVVAFSAMASAVYVANDLIDREADRRHPTKQRRPFASGALLLGFGMGLASLLACGSLSISIGLLPLMFSLMLMVYLCVSLLYSCWLKRKMIVDVLCLAGLYTLRILAGGEASAIVISPWLLAFSMFFFLSLAFAKRYAEVDLLKDESGSVGRGYITSDLDLIRSVGPACGCLSVLVLCLYLNSPEVLLLYPHHRRLWFLCPILLYWILRMWFITHRGRLREDPVLFALKDWASWLAGACSAIVILLASSKV